MKILVVRNDKLGDFITALPSLYIIKEHFPQSHLAVLVAPLNKSVAVACNFIDEVIIDEGESAKVLATLLRSKKFDLSITLFSNTRVAISQFLARIPKRIAPATKIAQIFYTKRVKQRRSQVKMAEFEYNMQLVQAVFPDIGMQYPQPLLKFDKGELEMVYNAFVQETKVTKKVIAFHPGFGGSSDANWSVEEYIDLAHQLDKHKEYDLVFTFGPGDEKFLDSFKKLKGNLNAHIYESKGSVLDFAKLIANFELFISTSTGTFHIASAVGTPTITFFADTLFASAKRWKGIGPLVKQHNFMIPKEESERKSYYTMIKSKLLMIVDSLNLDTKN